MTLFPYRMPPALIVFFVCMAVSAAAVWRLSPPYLSYDPRPFPLWTIVLIGSVALVPASGLAVGGAFANIAASFVWNGVPNYIIVGHQTFNAADITIIIGLFVMVAQAIGRSDS
jgi:hypothetical protein